MKKYSLIINVYRYFNLDYLNLDLFEVYLVYNKTL